MSPLRYNKPRLTAPCTVQFNPRSEVTINDSPQQNEEKLGGSRDDIHSVSENNVTAKSSDWNLAKSVLSETNKSRSSRPSGRDLTFGALLPDRNPAETLSSNGYHLF